MKWFYQHKDRLGWITKENGNCLIPLSQAEAFSLSLIYKEKDVQKITDILLKTGLITNHSKNVFIENLIVEFRPFISSLLSGDFQMPDPTEVLQQPFRKKRLSDYLFPRVAQIYITYQCPAHCDYCYWKGKNRADDSLLSVNDYNDLIDQFAANGLHSIIFTGGEPFAYPHFIQILMYAAARGIQSRIITKHFFTKDESDQLSRIGSDLCHLTISLDTVDNSKSEFLYHENNYVNERMQNLKLLQDSGVKYGIETVITSATVTDFPMLKRELSALGASRFFVNRYVPTEDVSDPLIIPDKLWKAFEQEVLTDADPRVVFLNEHKQVQQCRSGNYALTLLWNGEIVICEHLPPTGDNVLGNIKDVSVEELWKSRTQKTTACKLARK